MFSEIFTSSEFKTFSVATNEGISTVTFNFPPVNILGTDMIYDLNKLVNKLEKDTFVKVVIFESANPDFFIAHADTYMLTKIAQQSYSRNVVEPLELAKVLQRISELPQVTIAKIEGYARGGGHEFALACDMRFAARNKAIFMQMEVGMGILPCGGGAARMARQVGLGKALEIILSARDFNADEAEAFGTINKALDADKIGAYVFELATRISRFPSASITACKRAVYASIDLPIDQALKEEAYQLYQATSKTKAIKRFKTASNANFQENLNNQKNFETLLMGLQK